MAENKNDDKDSQYEALLKSNFKQQKLSAWRPVPTIASTTITFIVFGIIFIAIGVVVLVFSGQIVENSIDYTSSCTDDICKLELNVTAVMAPPIMVYYQLDNFYQNHRRYVKSKSSSQLAGEWITDVDSLTRDCEPVIRNSDLPAGTLSLSKKPLNATGLANPCGLIAKSFFNDRYSLFRQDVAITPIPIDETNIAWASDKELKYKKATGIENVDDYYWLDPTDEHFMVWMRPAGLPNFRKLWGRINQELAVGKYTLQINNNYKIDFGGKKYFVLSTVNAFGGQNSFLGISYICVGGICFLMALLFFFGYKSHSKTA